MLKNAYVLTGGIATGKSTVCSMLKEFGFFIIDADKIAKRELNNSKEEIWKIFGDKVFESGKLCRKKLADLIFSSLRDREKLNNLLHPKIKNSIYEEAHRQETFNKPYIIDIPLFFESGEYECKMSVVVYAPKEIQIKRLMKRDNLDKKDALKRLKAQIDIEIKKRRANWIIDNSKDLKHLQTEVEKFVKFVKEEYANCKI